MARLAFIGLGVMGGAMARHLAKAGHDMTVYNRTQSKADAGVAEHGGRSVAIALGVGGAIGFYDGFFGPGTGSFLIFLFIRLLGMDFLRASVSAKILNVAPGPFASGRLSPCSCSSSSSPCPSSSLSMSTAMNM